MKPGLAKKILNCSYTTLHNYVKAGKIKLSYNSGKQQNYDDESVKNLHDELYSVNDDFNNCIHIFLNNKKYEFKLDETIIKNIMNVILTDFSKGISK